MDSNQGVITERKSPGINTRISNRIQEFLAPADIRLNGGRDWDMQINHPLTFERLLRDGSLGLGEAYMQGLWDCKRLDQLFTRALEASLNKNLIGTARAKAYIASWFYSLTNRQTEARAFQVGEVHYDIGNTLYEKMLDPSMNYSCGYWQNADTLDQAQTRKMDLICRKLNLRPGMTLLDIGCGWGGLAEYAARHYGVSVTGITVSKEQKCFAEKRVEGLPVKIELIDYRKLEGRFDRIVSVGMFEHVGQKNYATYFNTVRRLLNPDGIFLLHTIGEERTSHAPDPFIEKYIFPNGKVPSRRFLSEATIEVFRLEDWHNFGPDYDRTLMAWAHNFETHWPEIKSDYDDRFYRMWRYYLYSCAAFFRSRHGQLWQLVLTHPQSSTAYNSVR